MSDKNWWEIVAGVLTIPTVLAALTFTALQIRKAILEIRKLSNELRSASLADTGGNRASRQHGWLTKREKLGFAIIYLLPTGSLLFWFVAEPPLSIRSIIVVTLAASLYPVAFMMMLGLAIVHFGRLWWSSIGELILSTRAESLAARTSTQAPAQDNRES